ncbi:hypothetical protein QBD01_002795 [Ochrobactrum sp. 19YEA23]|uniref:hypothetical protein n=1 Tax=Ochrobactrum sp. 19YEA23 TaxID=3039854 RepID=UPI00247A008B|nr:hypothetical protein [Ochrobactrum sp. 19YEA23]
MPNFSTGNPNFNQKIQLGCAPFFNILWLLALIFLIGVLTVKFGYLIFASDQDAEKVKSANKEILIFRKLGENLRIVCGPRPLSEVVEASDRAPLIARLYESEIVKEHEAELLVDFYLIVDKTMPEDYILMQSNDGIYIVIAPDGKTLGIFRNKVLAVAAAWKSKRAMDGENKRFTI